MLNVHKQSWWVRLGNRLINPNVIDSARSWFANFSGIAASVFAFLITGMAYYGAWSAQSENLRAGLLITALVMTHAEAILCLFYLHRVSLEALKAKVGAVEVSLDAQPVQQITVTSPQTVIQASPIQTTGSDSTITTSVNDGAVLRDGALQAGTPNPEAG